MKHTQVPRESRQTLELQCRGNVRVQEKSADGGGTDWATVEQLRVFSRDTPWRRSCEPDETRTGSWQQKQNRIHALHKSLSTEGHNGGDSGGAGQPRRRSPVKDCQEGRRQDTQVPATLTSEPACSGRIGKRVQGGDSENIKGRRAGTQRLSRDKQGQHEWSRADE